MLCASVYQEPRVLAKTINTLMDVGPFVGCKIAECIDKINICSNNNREYI